MKDVGLDEIVAVRLENELDRMILELAKGAEQADGERYENLKGWLTSIFNVGAYVRTTHMKLRIAAVWLGDMEAELVRLDAENKELRKKLEEAIENYEM